MQYIGDETILVIGFYILLMQVELLCKTIAVSRLTVGVHNVLYGYRLGAVGLPNPVCIGQVDAYRSGRVAVAGKKCVCDYLGRNSLYLLFLKTHVCR